MPIFSGGGGGGAAGALTLVSTTTLASQTTIDIQSISQNYTDLILVCQLRSARANIIENLGLRLNNDSANNYIAQNVQGVAAATGASRTAATSSAQFGSVPGTPATAGQFSTVEILLVNYANTSLLKVGQINLMTGFDAGGVVTAPLHTFTWASTAAINRVTIFGTTTAAMDIGSVVRIYGRK